MMAIKVLFFLLHTVTAHGIVIKDSVVNIYVSESGIDTDLCGTTAEVPCATLTHGLNRLEDSPGRLLVHGELQHSFCHEQPLLVNHSLEITGWGHKLGSIGCPQEWSRLLYFNISGSETTSFTIKNINVRQTMLYVECGQILIENCEMTDVTLMSDKASPYVSLTLLNTNWTTTNVKMDQGIQQKFYIGAPNVIQAHRLDLSFHQVTLKDSTLKVEAQRNLNFQISNSRFVGWHQQFQGVTGGLYVIVKDGMHMSKVIIENSIFMDQYYKDPIQSIMNLFEASLMVQAKLKGSAEGKSNVTVVVDNCMFTNNERGLVLIGSFNDVDVTNSIFKNNIAMQGGAGIFCLGDSKVEALSYISIRNCTFDSNAAGAYRPYLVNKETFQINGDEVSIKSECCNGIMSFQGNGGAMNIYRGSVHLSDSVFINNTARLRGGAINIGVDGKLSIAEVHFENSLSGVHGLEGDIIHSRSEKLSLRNTKIGGITAANDVSLLTHSGRYWSIKAENVSVQCPVGFRVHTTNDSAYGIGTTGIRRSYYVDQLSYFCKSCPLDHYSLDSGYLNYSLKYSHFAYYTLKTDGTQLEDVFDGGYTLHDIECTQCPYGGKCDQGIKAVANFWGYVHPEQRQVRFQHCPKGYCCTQGHCKMFNSCARHRTGRLCGRCKRHYSEALFSSECVHDDNCNATWLYPVALISGVLYALFLLFQNDVCDAMHMQTLTVKGDVMKIKKIKSDSKSSKQAGESENKIGTYNLDSCFQDIHTVGRDIDYYKNEDAWAVMGVRQIFDHEFGIVEELYGIVSDDQKTNDEIKCMQGALEGNANDEDGSIAKSVDNGTSYIIILFYYLQDAQLINVETIFVSDSNTYKTMIKSILSGLFDFRFDLSVFLDKLCFLPGLTPTYKLTITALMVPYVLVQFGVIFLLYHLYSLIMGKKQASHLKGNTSEVPAQNKTGVHSRLATGFVLALLFTYQKLATTSLTLLNCVPIGDETVLFVEGPISCYQIWQYGVMAYVVTCIIPFCLVLLLGPGLLQDRAITLSQFFCACLVPIPFVTYWIGLRIYNHFNDRTQQSNMSISTESHAVIDLLQGPFKEIKTKKFGHLCGQGIVTGQRLVLVLLATFVNDILKRMLCMIVLCFINLLHHVHTLPYKSMKDNHAGTASATALMVVAGINLVRAGFEAGEYVPQRTNDMLAQVMHVFEELEDVLMLWFPAAIIVIVLITICVKLVLMMLKKIRAKPKSHCVEVH